MSADARTDQNLLFGILALQMDFIDRDALIAAMNAWVLQKATPLGQVLLKQAAIDADTHTLLDALVRKHLILHGNAEMSLAAVSSVGSVRRQLEQIADGELNASLSHVAANRGDDDDRFPTRPPSVGASTSAGLRFRRLRPHAKGGLGEVFVAHDTELHREVALKEIQDRHADNADSRARFLLEAEITGGLEHPGIVPVYGLGAYADGRPFYAMRFIPGDSLQEAIARFHKADAPRREPGERALALRQLLGRFVDVCEAIAYAHSRGVLHRDLKPGNVMLGSYGETLVVDWGLAKAMGSQTTEANSTVLERPLQPQSTSSAMPTQMGSAVGTPAYMSPEQAAGRLDQLGPASDVYGLGAMLYALLTGKAPVMGGDLGEVLRKVRAGDFPQPRQVKRDVPAALEAVCLKAMALKPESRYPTPRALAADVERWLADEAVSAWREPWSMRARRWLRRHQAGVMTTAAILLGVLLAGGGAGWALWDRAAQETARRQELAGRLAETDKAVTVALTKTQRSEERANRLPCTTSVEAKVSLAEWREAEASLAEAETALRTGASSEELRERVAEVRQRIASGRMQTQREEKLFRDLDDARMAMATEKESDFDYAGGAAKYAAAFAEFGLEVQPGQTEVLAQRIRREAPAVRDALIVALDFWAFCDALNEVGSRRTLSSAKPRKMDLSAIAQAADEDAWRRDYRQAERNRDRAALVRLSKDARRLTLPPVSLQLLSVALYVNDRREEARDLMRWARGLHPADFWIAMSLGNLCGEATAAIPADLEEHIGCYRVAVALRPDASIGHYNLGHALRDKSQFDEAIAEYKKAILLNPQSAEAHTALGNALGHKNQMEEAIAEYKKAIDLDPKFATAHYNLGVNLGRKNQRDAAIVEYKKAIDLDPKHISAHFNLGCTLEDKNQLDDAIAEFKKARDLDPKDVKAHVRLGLALEEKHQLDDAIAEYKKAIDLDPKNALIHVALGGALRDKNQLDDAIAEYNKAIALDPKTAWPHNNLGDALLRQDRFAEAEASFQRGLELRSADDPERKETEQRMKQARRFVELGKKLPSLLSGETKPSDSATYYDLRTLFEIKQLHAAGARFGKRALADKPALADDLDKSFRYSVACFAASAAVGKGKDADELSDPERADFRKQALQWLRADLAAWGKRLDKDANKERPVVQGKMTHWKQDTDLAGVRDAKALAKLLPDERDAWQKLWKDVDALLAKTREKN